MDSAFNLDLFESVPAEGLLVDRARDLAQFLRAGEHSYARLLDTLSLTSSVILTNVVILEVEVERGQRTALDIRHREQVAVVFTSHDDDTPAIYALREDFPRAASHLYLYALDSPPRMCVYEEEWDTIRLRWTPMRFIERIRSWLARTAAGTLHADDQPLPPFLMGTYSHLVLPWGLLAQQDFDHPYYFHVRTVNSGLGRNTHIAEPLSSADTRGHLAIVIETAPQHQRSLQWRPTTLEDLHNITAPMGTDLLNQLRLALLSWWHATAGNGFNIDLTLMIILIIPNAPPHVATSPARNPQKDLWAFETTECVRNIGQLIDAWELHGDSIGILLLPDNAKRGRDVQIMPMRPHPAPEPALASWYSGVADNTELSLTLIGVGALGSHIFETLLRMGWGQWTLIDHDFVLPHNLARHALGGAAIGLPKVDQLVDMASEMFPQQTHVNGIIANVLDPLTNAESVTSSLRFASIIVDCSASVPVARYLTRDIEVDARRISLFLNPAGTDLVVLAEAADRSVPLDALEMQYYRALITDPQLEGHLHQHSEVIRVAHSCREVSAVLGQDRVTIHAGIGSGALRTIANETGASATVWRTIDDGSVTRIEISLTAVIEIDLPPWRVVTDEHVVRAVSQARGERLPNETGGILIGAYDLERKIVYVVDMLPSPSDSQEWPTMYVRGASGLQAQIDEIYASTLGMLEYVGEWHSHPMNAGIALSVADKAALEWLHELMAEEGLPALMLIVEDGYQGWHVGGRTTVVSSASTQLKW